MEKGLLNCLQWHEVSLEPQQGEKAIDWGLRVKSLSFQEQDHEVAACATSALWSIFHGTGKMFQHPILSPVEITKVAFEIMPLDTRAQAHNPTLLP